MSNVKCPFCGGTETRIGGGQVWCANEYCGAPLGNVHLGLIEGRHEMTVDGYLLKPVPLARLLEKAVELIDARDDAAGDADEGDEDGGPEGDEE